MPTHTTVHYRDVDQNNPELAERSFVIIGRADRLRDAEVLEWTGLSARVRDAMLEATTPGDGGASAETWIEDRKIVLGVLPEVCSRHNSPSRAWAIPGLAKKAKGDVFVLMLVDSPELGRAAALAASRAFPLYDARSTEDTQRSVLIAARSPDGFVSDPTMQAAIDGIRMAARLVDLPPNFLHTDAFVDEALQLAGELGPCVDTTVIREAELRSGGFGGLIGVGGAAVHGPALVALTYRPKAATRHVAWVGKGIVYDTGGLSLKGKTGMPGMKCDMGGAAAVIGAFGAAVRSGVDYAITAVLCLAENSIGSRATRPDDVLHMKSGKTVEVNNTDAEGRLVLADGVAWVCEVHSPDVLIDLATLTGAALVATGKAHAALYCSDADLEALAVVRGRSVGEPCHPLIYAPELFRKEFRSSVADMRNSVKDRGNAQASCAGQFIGNHLPEDAPPWLHMDIAGTAWDAETRGTGYGVALLLAIGAG
jgi:probable aminopeptidase NPEPL1